MGDRKPPRTELEAFLRRVGRTKKDLAEATDPKLRVATVYDVTNGRIAPGVRIATQLAEATVRLAEGTGVPPVTPAQILGIADWTPEAAE